METLDLLDAPSTGSSSSTRHYTKTTTPGSKLAPNGSPTKSLRVKFGNLPRPNHTLRRLFSFSLKPTAFGTIAQRRVENTDVRRDQYFKGWTEYWVRTRLGSRKPVFQQISWAEEPHPGRRVEIEELVARGDCSRIFIDTEDLSPKATLLSPESLVTTADAGSVAEIDSEDIGRWNKRRRRRLQKRRPGATSSRSRLACVVQ